MLMVDDLTIGFTLAKICRFHRYVVRSILNLKNKFVFLRSYQFERIDTMGNDNTISSWLKREHETSRFKSSRLFYGTSFKLTFRYGVTQRLQGPAPPRCRIM